MRLFRGIAVPHQAVDTVMAKIRTQGLPPRDGRWVMLAADLKPRLEEIWRVPAVSMADTRPKTDNPSWVCASGEEKGALFYACVHNKSHENDTPIFIAFEADSSETIVDGRDFLYTIFQLGNPDRSRPWNGCSEKQFFDMPSEHGRQSTNRNASRSVILRCKMMR